MYKSKISLIVSYAVLLISLVIYAPQVQCQTEYWDTKARARAENLSSSALNHLKSLHVGKQRRTHFWSRKKEGELRQAIVLLDRAIVADPTDPVPHYLLGIALCIQGNYEKALPVLQKANRLNPEEDEILLAAGLAQHLSGNYQKAFSIWTKLLNRTDRKGPIYVLIGHAQFRAGDLENAIESFNKAQSLEPSLQSAQEGMAWVYFVAGDLAKAKRSALHAQSIRDYPPVRLLLAEIECLEGDSADAKNLLKQWKKYTRRYKPNKSMTDIGFSKQHDFDWDPFIVDHYDSNYSVLARDAIRKEGKSLLKSDIQQAQGEKARQKAEKKAASREKRALSKANSLARKGKLSDALGKVESKIASRPNDFFLQHQKGMLLQAMQNFNQSITPFQKAIKLCPMNRIDCLNLAMTYDQAGDGVKAGKSVLKFQAVYPDSKLCKLFKSIKPVAPEKPKAATAGSIKSKTMPRKKNSRPVRKNSKGEMFPF